MYCLELPQNNVIYHRTHNRCLQHRFTQHFFRYRRIQEIHNLFIAFLQPSAILARSRTTFSARSTATLAFITAHAHAVVCFVRVWVSQQLVNAGNLPWNVGPILYLFTHHIITQTKPYGVYFSEYTVKVHISIRNFAKILGLDWAQKIQFYSKRKNNCRNWC